MPSSLLIIVAVLAIGYVFLQAGGGTLDSVSGDGPRSTSPLVNQMAQGIAKAEGYNVPGSRAARNHNPGDISDTYLAIGKDTGGLSIFPDNQTGWDALTHKLENILTGMSTAYPLSFNFLDLAQKWTGGDSINGTGATANWASTVAASVQLSTDNSLSDLAQTATA